MPRTTLRRDRPEKIIKVKVYPDFYERTRTPIKSGRIKGATSAMGLKRYFMFLLEINEYLPPEHRMTDYQLARAIIAEFHHYPKARDLLKPPNKGTSYHYSINDWRMRYNKGKLVRENNTWAPRRGPVSFRYDSKGRAIHYNTNHNSVLSPEQIRKRKLKYGDPNPGKRFEYEILEGGLDLRKKHLYNGQADYDSFTWDI